MGGRTLLESIKVQAQEKLPQRWRSLASLQLVALQQGVEHVDAQLPLAGNAHKLGAHAWNVIL